MPSGNSAATDAQDTAPSDSCGPCTLCTVTGSSGNQQPAVPRCCAPRQGTACNTHRGEPAVEVVHYHSSDERLAQACGQAGQRVVQRGRPRDAELVLARRRYRGVQPCPA
jgi:hypothetical protein